MGLQKTLYECDRWRANWGELVMARQRIELAAEEAERWGGGVTACSSTCCTAACGSHGLRPRPGAIAQPFQPAQRKAPHPRSTVARAFGVAVHRSWSLVEIGNFDRIIWQANQGDSTHDYPPTYYNTERYDCGAYKYQRGDKRRYPDNGAMTQRPIPTIIFFSNTTPKCTKC